MKKLITILATTLILGSGYLAIAQSSNSAKHKPMGKSNASTQMQMCQEMGKEKKMMMAHMSEMDSKLDALVSTMDSKTGDEKVAATSDVVREIVSQRKMMSHMMMSMDEKMMGHMMTHMKPGQMKKDMMMCPMMGNMKGM